MTKNERKINVVTLGCSKNIVDSEVLMKQLDINGWKVVYDSNDLSAKYVIINTCGFISDAKEESIETILNFINAKRKGVINKVYVMGCLSQRYKAELEKEMPEVDGYYGVSDLQIILKDIDSKYFQESTTNRLISTPKHYAYLKIAEGCNWGCSYCAIPLIRGKYKSRSIDSLVEEGILLVNQGVKEIIIIAQDTTYFGLDSTGKRKLAELLTALSTINGLEWVRLQYTYPAHFPLDLMDIVNTNPKVCKYIDIPFQHITDRMLRIMRRGISKDETINLIKTLRKEIPGVTLRTTLIVGHPGESEDDFNKLVDFVRDMKFERLGVFKYSEEEGTYSALQYHDTITDEIKETRYNKLMSIQQEISQELNSQMVRKTIKVIVDRKEDQLLICRTEGDSPEVDQEVLVDNPGRNVQTGDFLKVKITSYDNYDLYGKVDE